MLKQLYDSLTEGQKATLRRKYTSLFGSKYSFYRKIKGETRVLRSEQIFFENNLITNK